MIPLQFLCFEAVDGEHIHLGEACGPEGSGCFAKESIGYPISYFLKRQVLDVIIKLFRQHFNSFGHK